jgi:hypothetical protein
MALDPKQSTESKEKIIDVTPIDTKIKVENNRWLDKSWFGFGFAVVFLVWSLANLAVGDWYNFLVNFLLTISLFSASQKFYDIIKVQPNHKFIRILNIVLSVVIITLIIAGFTLLN